LDIIEKAMKDFYNDDLSIMTHVIMQNITVSIQRALRHSIASLQLSRHASARN